MRATESTHCSRGVDTYPPPNFSVCQRNTIRLEQDCAPFQIANTHRRENSKAVKKQTQVIGMTFVTADNFPVLYAFETALGKATVA